MAKKKKAVKKAVTKNSFLHDAKPSANPFLAGGKKSVSLPPQRRFSRTK